MLNSLNTVQDGTGTAAAVSGGTDCWIIKLSQYGEYINAFQFGSNMDDFIGGIVVASDGLYAAAIREDQMLGIPPEGGLDSVIVKFTLDLTFVWAGLVGGEGNDIVHGLHLYTGSTEDGRERVLAFGTTDSNLYAPVLPLSGKMSSSQFTASAHTQILSGAGRLGLLVLMLQQE